MVETSLSADGSPSEMIDRRIADLGDWRGEMLGQLRAAINRVTATGIAPMSMNEIDAEVTADRAEQQRAGGR